MGHKKSIGLPGGPNEFLQDITQYISIEGYKNDSPDKNNPVNIIESSNITMEGVDFPVRGYGNNGVVQDMTPGAPHYDYGNADYVVEVPMAQEGGCTSCTESMRQREGSYNKGKEYILDPRFKQEGGSTTNPYTIYMNYINGIDESEVAQNIFDKLNRMHYRDAKTRGMGVANYIASNIIPNS
tara:strand:- start:841 stop:1389 length:549 start_codon:yes stop_codon:yes gene_type:complete